MADALEVLQAQCEKLTAKVDRLRSGLDAAESELSDTQTALRVLSKLGVTASVPDADISNLSDAHATIVEVVPYGKARGLAPKDVWYKLNAAGETEMSADYVRTTLWRLAKKGELGSADGVYWRETEQEIEASDDHSPEASNGTGPVGRENGFPPTPPEGSTPSGSTPVQSPDWGELDDDVPF